MAILEVRPKTPLGFMTVVDHPQHGLFGGYLLLNPAGRPLEFHCTAPVRPNRAQRILYGPTLEPFLYGEQIGHTLLSAASLDPSVVCIDLPALLEVRRHMRTPVALVLLSDRPTDDLTTFELGRNRLAVPQQYQDDRRLIVERLADLPESLDLGEPFGRIREAIEEAQQAVLSGAA